MCGTGLKEVLEIPTHILVNRYELSEALSDCTEQDSSTCRFSCPIMEHVAWTMGIPLAQSYVPAVADVDVSDKMTYYERVINIIESMGALYVYTEMATETTKTYRKHFG